MKTCRRLSLPVCTRWTYLIHADDVAGRWSLALLDATDFIGGQRQRGPTDGSHFAVQVQGVGRRVAGVFRFKLGQGGPSDAGVEHRRVRLGGVYHIVRNEGEFGWKDEKRKICVKFLSSGGGLKV